MTDDDMPDMSHMTPEEQYKLLRRAQRKAYEQSDAGKAKRAQAIAVRKSPYAKGCGPNASRTRSYNMR